MQNERFSMLAAFMLAAALPLAAFAGGGAATTVPVKMGYFNLLQVKASYPEAAAASSLEERAKDMLRRDVEQANNQLQELQKQNKPKEEIEKRAKELQTEIFAKQQALSSLLSSNSAEANRAITQAVAQVAKDRGLDLVIDASGIYAGGDKFANNGEDVTDAIVKRLNPAAAAAVAKPEKVEK